MPCSTTTTEGMGWQQKVCLEMVRKINRSGKLREQGWKVPK
ncbi:hypothetical protein [Microseira wollei]|nr:hypothetical protein [Microseira wollei]